MATGTANDGQIPITPAGAPNGGSSFQPTELEEIKVKIEPGVNLFDEETYGWCVDTGATQHMCANKSLFWGYQPIKEEKVVMANSTTSNIVGYGNVTLNLKSGNVLVIRDVLHVPDLQGNFISGIQLTTLGYKLEFVANKFRLSHHGLVIGEATVNEGLWMMDLRVVK